MPELAAPFTWIGGDAMLLMIEQCGGPVVAARHIDI
jgi:hypothetical protein